MERWLHDLRFSLRSLKNSPGFTIVVLLTLGLGIGANVAIFSVVNSVLLRPLPYHEPDRLVHLWTSSPLTPKGPVSAPDVAAFRQHASLFDGIAARFGGWNATLTGIDTPQHVRVGIITHDFFSLLGVAPLIGRGFLPEDGERAHTEEADSVQPPPAVVLSYGLWQRVFGEDPRVLDRTIEISGWPARIVGVMPRGFRIVRDAQVARTSDADLWMAIEWDLSQGNAVQRNMRAVGRLRPAVDRAQAQAEIDALMAARREAVDEYRAQDMQGLVIPMHEDVVGHIRPALIVLLGAVAFLLLLVCANVANLLLVRGRGRRGEVAVRAALGCGRGGLMRQVLVESVILSLAGGLAGLGIGWVGIQLLLALRPSELPSADGIGVSGAVLLFAFLLSLITAVLFGLLPAIQTGRLNLTEALKHQSRGTAGGHRRGLLNGLVVVEVGLSLVLLLGAGLMLRSFSALQETNPGFDPDGVLTFAVNLYGPQYRPEEARIGFFREMQERVGALPGVKAVGSNYMLPLAGGLWTGAYAYDEETEARWPSETANVRIVTPGYFRAMGTRLLAGRDFTEQEMAEPLPVMIVDEKLALRAWPGQDPIGRTITVEDFGKRTKLEVVGVVEHVRVQDLDADGEETVYWSFGSRPFNQMKVAVRASGDPSRLMALIREEIRLMNPALALYQVSTMREIVDEMMAPTRFLVVLMGVFGGLAMTVAAVGLYGVIAYAVRQRTSEIGVRVAFGAEKRRILSLVVGQGLRLTLLGLVLGMGGAAIMSRFIGSVLYGVSATDPKTMGTVAVILAVVAAAACYVPARRASLIDPIVALRNE
jgi:putative ABC transport system permease protein